MGFIFSKKKPEVGDRGFIVGNRFVPLKNDSKDWYVSKNLVSLITADSFEIDNITNQQTIKNVSSLNFDGIDDYLIVKYNLSNLSEFTFAIKFKALKNGILIGMNDEKNPPNGCNAYCPLLYILDNGFEAHVWDDTDIIFKYNGGNIKDKDNVLVVCKNRNVLKCYLNGNFLGETNGGLNISWAKSYSLASGYTDIDNNRPIYNSVGWKYTNCEISYVALYNKFLTDEEVSNFN